MGILSFAGRWTKEAVLDVNGWEDILCGVDIGTEWNLKCGCNGHGGGAGIVDIGTEWNLKSLVWFTSSRSILLI